MKRKILKFEILLLSSLFLYAAIANATTINNGGFETGNLTGWTVVEPGAAGFPNFPNNANVYGAGIIAPGGWPFFTSAPSEGSFAFLNRFDGSGPMTMRLYQYILVTADTPIIEFDYRAAWAIGISAPASQDRTFAVNIRTGPSDNRVDHRIPILTAQRGTYVGFSVCSPSGGCNPPTPDWPGYEQDTGLLTGSVDLTPFIGDTTAALHFEWIIPEPFTGPGFFQLDNIRAVSSTVVPEPATMLLLGLSLVGLAAKRRKL